MMMKIRHLLFTMCLAAMALPASAENLEAPRFEFGLRGGLSVSNWSYGDANALVMPQGGISLSLRVALVPLYLESGLYFVDKGARIDDMYYDDDGWWDSYDRHSSRGYDTYSVHQPTLQIPLLMSYHHYFNPKLSIRPFVGFYVAPVLNTDDGELFYENDNVDVGFKLGCGMGYGALYGGMAFDISSNGYDYGWDYDNNVTFSLTVGVNFSTGGSKHEQTRRSYGNYGDDDYIH